MAFPLPQLHPQRGVAPARQGEAAVIPRGKIQPFQFQPGSLGAVGFVQGLLRGLVQHGQRLPQGGFGPGGGAGLQNAVGQAGQNGIPHLQLDQLILQRVAVGQNVQPHRVGADAVGYLAAVGGESCK